MPPNLESLTDIILEHILGFAVSGVPLPCLIPNRRIQPMFIKLVNQFSLWRSDRLSTLRVSTIKWITKLFDPSQPKCIRIETQVKEEVGKAHWSYAKSTLSNYFRFVHLQTESSVEEPVFKDGYGQEQTLFLSRLKLISPAARLSLAWHIVQGALFYGHSLHPGFKLLAIYQQRDGGRNMNAHLFALLGLPTGTFVTVLCGGDLTDSDLDLTVRGGLTLAQVHEALSASKLSESSFFIDMLDKLLNCFQGELSQDAWEETWSSMDIIGDDHEPDDNIMMDMWSQELIDPLTADEVMGLLSNASSE